MVSQVRALDPQHVVGLAAVAWPVIELDLRLVVGLAAVVSLSLATSPVRLTLTSAAVPSLAEELHPHSALGWAAAPSQSSKSLLPHAHSRSLLDAGRYLPRMDIPAGSV